MAIIIDTECYQNYWLFAALNTETHRVRQVEIYDNASLSEDDIKLIRDTMKRETVSFNGYKYDLPMITAALSGYNTKALHQFSTDLIMSSFPAWHITRQRDLTVADYNHIDLIEIAIGQGSLKVYGSRLHCKTLQDLPIEPDEIISPAQREQLKVYCRNDLELTELLYTTLLPQIELRKSMSTQYGINLNSKSDAQIAEALIKSEMQSLYKIPAAKFKAKSYPPKFSFNYRDPKIIKFKSQHLKDVFNRLLTEKFTIADSGTLECPKWLGERITVGTTEYQMGIGGIHSCEKAQYITSNDEYALSDFDVGSFYPSIIMQQELYPDNIGKKFLELYKSIITRRIEAKRNKDNVTADTLKICLNGSYGKFGSKYSFLYSPELLLQTTITGQLSLLMLVETLEDNNLKVVSANTDGIVVYYKRTELDKVHELLWDWELQTSYQLEQTDYQAIASRDVNSYLAIKTNGSYKGKGIFAGESIGKNPDGRIVYDAVTQRVINGTPVEQTISECKDIGKFISCRRVTGGAIFDGEYLGKAIRFYHSNAHALQDKQLEYKKNGNKVPLSQACRPCMVLPDTFPVDVDLDYYITKAKELLEDIGYVRKTS